MAKVIKEVGRPHDCQTELKQDLGRFDLHPGSIAECSCLKRFELRDDQRDGLYWSECRSDGWPYEPSSQTGGYRSPARSGILPPVPSGPAEGPAVRGSSSVSTAKAVDHD